MEDRGSSHNDRWVHDEGLPSIVLQQSCLLLDFANGIHRTSVESERLSSHCHEHSCLLIHVSWRGLRCFGYCDVVSALPEECQVIPLLCCRHAELSYQALKPFNYMTSSVDFISPILLWLMVGEIQFDELFIQRKISSLRRN